MKHFSGTEIVIWWYTTYKGVWSAVYESTSWRIREWRFCFPNKCWRVELL